MATTVISESNNRRYTLPSTSFVDPAIVRFIEKSNAPPDQQVFSQYDDEEDTTTVPSSFSSSPLMTQRLSPPQPTASTSLDHLWSKQERYDNLELRLFSLEESEKRFERRLQQLERERNHPSHHMLTLLKQQPMKPDQQSTTTDNHMQNDLDDAHDDNNKNYMQLYNSLLEKYDALKIEFSNKEKQYEEKIRELQLKCLEKHTPVAESKPCYREENGYLLFDTTNMNGEIIHCKVKIPTHNQQQRQKPAPHNTVRRGNFITTTLNAPSRARSPLPQQSYMTLPRHITSPKTSLNPNAPEWKKKDRHTSTSFYN